MNNVWKLLALALVCCLGFACETTGPSQGGPVAPRAGNAKGNSTLILRVGEKIQITLADLPGGATITADPTIPEDGKITLHLDQTFVAVGKTRTQLEAEIRTRYVPSYYAKITVSVKQEDRWMYVGGFVRNPNRYPHTPGLTILKAISVAGGFSEFGKKTEVTVTRDGEKITVDCEKALKDPRLDIPILPDDQIYVPRRGFLQP
jgi:polysaccharide export outer membrane protein